MTLIELLVVLAISAVIGGIILETFVSVDRGARQCEDELTMATAAQTTAAGIAAALRQAVGPAALDGPVGADNYEFTAAKCVVPAVGQKGSGLERTTIEERTGPGKPKGACVRVASTPIGSAQGEASELLLGTGGAAEQFSTTVTFEYATTINGVGFEPQFKTQLAPGEYPQLVRMHVQVEDLKNRGKTFKLVTAVRLP